MFRDFENNLRHDTLVIPANLTADSNGYSVDLQGYRYLAFYAVIGVSADSLDGSNYICLEVEESADNSSSTDVVNADITNSVTAVNTGTFAKIDAAGEDEQIYMCEYSGSARYVRPVINMVGTHSSGTPITVIALRSGDQSVAVTQGS